MASLGHVHNFLDSCLFIVCFFSCDRAVLDGPAIKKIAKRVLVSNCVKRAFVNECKAYMEA